MTDPFSLRYFDDNKKNTFNNGSNYGHRLVNLTCKQTLNVGVVSMVLNADGSDVGCPIEKKNLIIRNSWNKCIER